jgi:hypothetical protein
LRRFTASTKAAPEPHHYPQYLHGELRAIHAVLMPLGSVRRRDGRPYPDAWRGRQFVCRSASKMANRQGRNADYPILAALQALDPHRVLPEHQLIDIFCIEIWYRDLTYGKMTPFGLVSATVGLP